MPLLNYVTLSGMDPRIKYKRTVQHKHLPERIDTNYESLNNGRRCPYCDVTQDFQNIHVN
jgi:hypothetical protein